MFFSLHTSMDLERHSIQRGGIIEQDLPSSDNDVQFLKSINQHGRSDHHNQSQDRLERMRAVNAAGDGIGARASHEAHVKPFYGIVKSHSSCRRFGSAYASSCNATMAQASTAD